MSRIFRLIVLIVSMLWTVCEYVGWFIIKLIPGIIGWITISYTASTVIDWLMD